MNPAQPRANDPDATPEDLLPAHWLRTLVAGIHATHRQSRTVPGSGVDRDALLHAYEDLVATVLAAATTGRSCIVNVVPPTATHVGDMARLRAAMLDERIAGVVRTVEQVATHLLHLTATTIKVPSNTVPAPPTTARGQSLSLLVTPATPADSIDPSVTTPTPTATSAFPWPPVPPTPRGWTTGTAPAPFDRLMFLCGMLVGGKPSLSDPAQVTATDENVSWRKSGTAPPVPQQRAHRTSMISLKPATTTTQGRKLSAAAAVVAAAGSTPRSSMSSTDTPPPPPLSAQLPSGSPRRRTLPTLLTDPDHLSARNAILAGPASAGLPYRPPTNVADLAATAAAGIRRRASQYRTSGSGVAGVPVTSTSMSVGPKRVANIVVVVLDPPNEDPRRGLTVAIQQAMLEVLARRQVTDGRVLYQVPRPFCFVVVVPVAGVSAVPPALQAGQQNEEEVFWARVAQAESGYALPLMPPLLDQFIMSVTIEHDLYPTVSSSSSFPVPKSLNLKSINALDFWHARQQSIYLHPHLKRYLRDVLVAARTHPATTTPFAALLHHMPTPPDIYTPRLLRLERAGHAPAISTHALNDLTLAVRAMGALYDCEYATPEIAQWLVPRVLAHRVASVATAAAVAAAGQEEGEVVGKGPEPAQMVAVVDALERVVPPM
ncbi:hypothetical protein GGF31_006465 [Allomyces arbusculus]|nr:hypothetical protein GGF31_006465 [Allomyces arbusculus]